MGLRAGDGLRQATEEIEGFGAGRESSHESFNLVLGATGGAVQHLVNVLFVQHFLVAGKASIPSLVAVSRRWRRRTMGDAAKVQGCEMMASWGLIRLMAAMGALSVWRLSSEIEKRHMIYAESRDLRRSQTPQALAPRHGSAGQTSATLGQAQAVYLIDARALAHSSTPPAAPKKKKEF